MLAKKYLKDVKIRRDQLKKIKNLSEFENNYADLLTQNNLVLFKDFIEIYKNYDVDQTKINNVNYLIDTYPNSIYQNYLNIQKNKKIINCSFIDFSCGKPLNLPIFDRNNIIINYKRLKLYPKNVWQKSEITLNKDQIISIIPYGSVTLNPKKSFEKNIDQQLLIIFSINKNKIYQLNQYQITNGYITLKI